jgi:hypothetical protein
MQACVGHPKSRATDEHERVTKDLSRRLGESLKDDEGDPKSSRVCSPPRGSLSSTMPTLHKSSSIQVAQAVTRLIYQHSLKQCGMSSEVSERKMAFLGRARVRQNQSFADTNSIFALRKSQGQLARRNTLHLSHALLCSLDWSRTREALTARLGWWDCNITRNIVIYFYLYVS